MYNDELRDLFAPLARGLKVAHDLDRGAFIKGLQVAAAHAHTHEEIEEGGVASIFTILFMEF